VIAARKRKTSMCGIATLRVSVFAAVLAALSLANVGHALALDERTVVTKPERSPWAVFRFGFSAYKQGHKDQAAEAYRYAAENGQIGARWKLARMYAEGDGVPRDDYEAFKFFSEIARQDVEPGAQEESFVSDALVELARYTKAGIPGSPVRPNPQAAQEYYMRAAATYRNPDAQYEIGKMLLDGDGVKRNVQQAGRWFQLAAAKCHAAAQATLGNLLFGSGATVRGLGWMTAALASPRPGDVEWIRMKHEEAFALSTEADRRTAIALSEDILGKCVH
jgi:uncharacterized protein